MTMYISSFYRNIQKEFHSKDVKKSRLVRTIEYFDRSKQPPSKPKTSNEPDIRRVSRDMNQMTLSMDSSAQRKNGTSHLLGRPTERTNRFSNASYKNQIQTRRSSIAETRRSRSLARPVDTPQIKLTEDGTGRKNSLPVNQYSRDSATRQRQARRHSTNQMALRVPDMSFNRNIQSNKSTEGSKIKVKPRRQPMNYNFLISNRGFAFIDVI